MILFKAMFKLPKTNASIANKHYHYHSKSRRLYYCTR